MKNKNYRELPPLHVLQSRFDYDPITGITRYKRTGKAVKQTRKPYVWIGKRNYILSRVVYKLHTGIDPHGHMVDHKNGNPLDQRASNLRLASPSDNMKNRKKNDSQKLYKGVTPFRKKFMAQCDGKYLGLYEDPFDAHIAYREYAAANFGEFARFE